MASSSHQGASGSRPRHLDGELAVRDLRQLVVHGQAVAAGHLDHQVRAGRRATDPQHGVAPAWAGR
jgi:hypothetical protein